MNKKTRKKVYDLLDQGANKKVVLMVILDLIKDKPNDVKADEIMRFYAYVNERRVNI